MRNATKENDQFMSSGNIFSPFSELSSGGHESNGFSFACDNVYFFSCFIRRISKHTGRRFLSPSFNVVSDGMSLAPHCNATTI